MSCSYHIKCLDCDDELRFDNTNHKDDEMRVLIANAGLVADLAPVVRALGGWPAALTLGQNYGEIDTEWFAKHRGHRMQPIDEYGQLDDQCHERVQCASCVSQYPCWLKVGHVGAHRRRCQTWLGMPGLQCAEADGHYGGHSR